MKEIILDAMYQHLLNHKAKCYLMSCSSESGEVAGYSLPINQCSALTAEKIAILKPIPID